MDANVNYVFFEKVIKMRYIRVLFACHGTLLKLRQKASKIKVWKA